MLKLTAKKVKKSMHQMEINKPWYFVKISVQTKDCQINVCFLIYKHIRELQDVKCFTGYMKHQKINTSLLRMTPRYPSYKKLRFSYPLYIYNQNNLFHK